MTRDKLIWIVCSSALVAGAGLIALLVWIGSLMGQNSVSEAPSESPSSSIGPAASATATAGTELAEGACPDIGEVDRSDADAVAAAVMGIGFCFDSTVDQTMTDALRRAEPLMTEQMKGLLVENGHNALASQFLVAYEQRAYTTVTVEFMGADSHDHEEDPTAAADEHSDEHVHYSTQYASWQWVSRIGEGSMPGGYSVWTMRLVQDDAGLWLVDGYELGSFAPAS